MMYAVFLLSVESHQFRHHMFVYHHGGFPVFTQLGYEDPFMSGMIRRRIDESVCI